MTVPLVLKPVGVATPLIAAQNGTAASSPAGKWWKEACIYQVGGALETVSLASDVLPYSDLPRELRGLHWRRHGRPAWHPRQAGLHFRARSGLRVDLSVFQVVSALGALSFSSQLAPALTHVSLQSPVRPGVRVP